MEKVSLPQEIVEAIGEFRRCGETTVDMVTAIFGGANSKAAHTLRKFSRDEDRFDDLLKALVNGYEVEQTPEDKVREYVEDLKMKHYNATGSMNNAESPSGHELRGCLRTLDKLNINIPGVNTE